MKFDMLMLEVSTCVAQYKNALVINREASSITFKFAHVPKCRVLAVKCSVNALHCIALKVECSV